MSAPIRRRLCAASALPRDRAQLVGYLGQAVGQATRLDCRHSQKEVRTVEPCRFMAPKRSGNRGIRNRQGEHRAAEFGGKGSGLALDFEKCADDLPIIGLRQAKDARLEPLMIEPGPHAVHLFVKVILGDRDFGDVEHGVSLSSPRIGSDRSAVPGGVSAT